MVTKCYYKWISNLLTISFLTHMQAFLLRHHNCHYLDKLQARIIVKSSLFCQYNSSLDFVRIFCYFGKRYKIMRYRYDVYDDKDTVRSKDSISQKSSARDQPVFMHITQYTFMQFRKVASLSFCVDPKDCQGKRRQSF